MNDSRSALRRRLLASRAAQNDSAQQEASRSIAPRVLERVQSVAGASRVGAYLSYGSELDLAPALVTLVTHGYDIVLPVSGPDFSVEFCPWAPGDAMQSGLYGILEPMTEPVPPASIQVVLVPGVGFGPDGSRIGHGAGYYDRFFARCFALDHDPRRLGVAHDLQVVDLPPPEPWDVEMHEIITPSKVHHVAP